MLMLAQSYHKSLKNRFTQFWKYLAYHHKWAESLLYLMFISGLLLWESVNSSWQLQRWMLLLHIVIGATLFSIIMGAFWASHRQFLHSSRNKFLRKTGLFIEWLLITSCLSGFYLLFYGAPGNTFSALIQNVHFYSSWLLAPLVFRHAMRWSVLNFKKFIKH